MSPEAPPARFVPESGLLIGARLDRLLPLTDSLGEFGYSCQAVVRGEGLRALVEGRPDFVVLDHDPPDPEAWRLLTRLIELDSVPILVIADAAPGDSTARALRMGADAFLRKPIGAAELAARLEALARRGGAGSAPPTRLADALIEIDVVGRSVLAGGAEVALTPTEFRMLVALARHPDEPLSHTRLVELVWPDSFRDIGEVKLYISYLRRSLGRVAGIDPVETVRGIGYRYRPRLV